MNSVIWWVRRDLRLSDNPTLTEALQRAPMVIPTYVLSDRDPDRGGNTTHQRRFLESGLKILDAQLRQRGSLLVVRHGPPVRALTRLIQETGCDGVVAQADYSAGGRRETEAVSQLPVSWVEGQSIRHPNDVLKSDGQPYTTFTPFMRAWKKLPLPRQADPSAPERIQSPEGLQSIQLSPEDQDDPLLKPGETAARRRLASFVGGRKPTIYSYSSARDRLDLHEGTSLLSPYIHFGMLSPAQTAWTARRAMDAAHDSQSLEGAETWLNELIWRDFFISISYHFPFTSENSFKVRMRGIEWKNSPEDFQAWCEGRTGYPVVDAGMRQLRQTGWMHNRARMITASFLVKNLLIDWKMGEEWFGSHLLDADEAVNNGNWQWVAGTGTDASPWFRIFNPTLQGQKFDPEGTYVRRWIPELKDVPSRVLHTPWTMSSSDQRDFHCTIGVDYPVPIVDYKQSRVRALELWTHLRNRD